MTASPIEYPLIISPYKKKGSIIKILSEYTEGWFDDGQTANNKHFDYLDSYFAEGDLCPKTVVYELDYMDKSYLEDYARYYSRSFRNYPKQCIRLHFFQKKFNTKNFIMDFLKNGGNNDESYQNTYLGFVVLRPLPLTIFGAICLKTYPENKHERGERHFPTIREYKVHLAGKEFRVKTLGYQEQDKAVSACATSALWMTFQGTSPLFKHPLPSPYEITLDAKTYIRKNLPHEGLNSDQMIYAIAKQGLQPVTLSPDNPSLFKAWLYAYLKCGIPIIVGIKLYEKKDNIADSQEELNKADLHAITVTGFDHEQGWEPCKFVDVDTDEKHPSLFLESSRIRTLYVHDDQIGPFSRMIFGMEEKEGIESTELSTSWGNGKKQVRAIPTFILLPLYSKIRIPFDTILGIVREFSAMLTQSCIAWDIYLTTVCDIKKKFLNDYGYQIADEDKLKLLTYNHPRYIWVAEARYKMAERPLNPHFAFYFDATDVPKSDFFLYALHLDPLIYIRIKKEIICAEKYVNAVEQSNKRYYQTKQIISCYKQKTTLHSSDRRRIPAGINIKPLPKIIYDRQKVQDNPLFQA